MKKSIEAKFGPIFVLSLVALLTCCASSSTLAAIYYWDNNGSTSGFGTASGTWAMPTSGNSAQGWSTSSGGTLVPGNVSTLNGDTVNFGTAALALGAGMVTVSGFVTNTILNIATNSLITLAGGTIVLAGTSPAINGSAPNTVIGSAIVLLANTTINAPNINTGTTAAVPLTLNGSVSGAASVTFNGVQANNAYGTIILNAPSTYTGTTLIDTSGSSNTEIFVKLGVDNALPATTVLTLDGGDGTGSGRFCELNLNGNDQTLAGLISVSGRTLRTQRVNNTSGTASILTINNSADYVYAAQLVGNLSLAKSGAGTFTLSGINTYTGSTTINAGTLTLDGAGQLGSGSYAGNITNNAAFNYSSTAAQTLSGVISGSGSLTNSGSGTLTLTGTDALPRTILNGGTFAVSGSGNVSALVSVNAGGTLSLTGGGSVNKVTVNAGGSVSLPDTGTVTNLVFTNSGTMSFNFSTGTTVGNLTVTAADGITNNGAAGSITINITGATPTNGTYTLINYSGSLRGSGFSAYQLGTGPVGKSYALTNATGAVKLVVTPSVPSVWVETKADGTGVAVPDATVLTGTSLTNFAILRDPYGAFLTNPPATWVLTNITGAVASSNLVAVLGGKSAVFKPTGAGSARILAAVAGMNSEPSGTITSIALTARPFIWVRDSDKAGILAKIATNAWATSVFNSLVSREAPSLASYQANRDNYLRGLPVLWSSSPPLFETEPTYSVRSAAESKFNDALDCAILYYLTQDTNYAQCAADILHNTVKTLAPVAVTAPSQNGGWIMQDNWNVECRVLATQLPIIYDFVYSYIQTNQVYDVQTAGMVNFNFVSAQTVFTNYYVLARDHGDANDNWCSLEATAMLNNLLALDNATARSNFLTVYLTTGASRQDSLDYDYNRDYNNPGDIWNESLQYSTAVTTIRANNMVLIERYDPTRNLLNVYSNILSALPRSAQLVYPNKNDEPLFGDAHQGDGAAQPYDIYEQVYAHSRARGYTNWVAMFGGLLNGGINAGHYNRSTLSDYVSLGQHNEPLQLLWSAPTITEAPVYLTYPRTDALPWAGITLQRNPSTYNDLTYGLMCFVGGAAFTHGHASGMNMELFGLGYVLGGKSGRDAYGSAIHDDYYRLFSGHNTIVVNAGSQGSGGWSGLAINTVQNVAMEPQAFTAAVSSNYSFTCSSFADNMGTLAEATQQRTMGIIRTSPTNGFYVDFFRSKSTVTTRVATTLNGNVTNQFHDYIYRNVGASGAMTLKTNGAALGLFSQPNRFQNDVGDVYNQPGWEYFTNQGVSYPQNQLTRVHFAADPGDGNNRDTEMWVAAVTNREFAKVNSPPFSEWVDSTAPGPTVVIRQIGDAWDKPFAVVYEPYFASAGSTVTNVTPLLRSNVVVGLKIESKLAGKGTVHYVFSNPNATDTYTNAAIGLTFKGRFGVVADNGDGSTVLYLGQGSSLTYDGYSVASVGGTNTQAEVRFVPGQAPQITANAPVAIAVAVIKANNPTNLVLGGSWLFGVAPTATDLAIWDSTVAAANTTVLGANANWGGIQILNPGGPVAINAGNSLTLGATTTDIDMSSAAADLTLNCDLVLGAANVWDVANSRTLTVGGVVSGAQNLTKQGAGTVILSGANAYSGNTTISAGTLKLGAAEVIPNGTGNGNVSISASGQLDLNAFSETINGLTGTGTVDNTGAGTATLTVGDNNAVGTFDGVITNTAGTLSLVKIGTNTLTLSGTNGYSGGTTNSGATGSINANSSRAFGTGPFIFDGGRRLVIATGLDVTNAIIIGGNSGLTGRGLVEAGTAAGIATISGSIAINNSAAAGGHFAAPTANTILRVSGPITASVPVGARIGTVIFSGGGTGYTSLINNQDVTQIGAENGIATTAAVQIGASAAGILDLNGFNQSLAGITGTAANATITNSSQTTAVTLTITGTSPYGGKITDNGGAGKLNLTVNGGSLTLTGTNTYTGNTTVSNGTLVIAVASMATNSTVSVTGAAILQLNFATTNRLAGFVTNGVSLPPGVYKAANAAPFIIGSGSLQVVGGIPSPPTIAPVTVSGTNLVVSVATVLGANYVLQSATNLTPTINWLNESTNVGTGANLIFNVPIQPAQPQKYLRFWLY